MSEPYDDHLIGDSAFAELRERQLLLMHATDVRILDHTQKLAETLAFVVSETRSILGADWSASCLSIADGLQIAVASDEAEIGRIVPVDESISGQVLSTKQPILVNDLESDPRLRDQVLPAGGNEPGGSPAAPERPCRRAHPRSADDRRHQRGGAPTCTFRQAHLDFVTGVAQQISMAITHAALFDEDAFGTPPTGCCSRPRQAEATR